jgi:hypothetical protein
VLANPDSWPKQQPAATANLNFSEQKMPKFPLKFRQRLLKRRDIIAVQASLRLVSDLLKPQYGRRIARLRQ